jgi:hypothetical protein
VIDTTPPTVTAPAAVALECNSLGGIPAFDPQIRSWLASAVASDSCGAAVLTNDAPDFFPVRTTMVTFTAVDQSSNVRAGTSTVTVADTTPPEIAVSVDPDTLWPPNHRMIDIEASVTTSDNCGEPLVRLTSISSNEPDDARGSGDGRTAHDIQAAIGSEDYEFRLRAERAAAGGSRTYRITYTATDDSGNERSVTADVVVPRDQRRSK